MALVTTPGAADANSYCSLSDANSYNATRLGGASWAAATEPNREAALMLATRLLDAMPQAWTGAAVDAVQALRWPRIGMLSRNGFAIATDAIPAELRDATAEFARRLIAADSTGNNDVINQFITGVKAGSVQVSFGTPSPKDLNESFLVSDNLTADPSGRLMVPDIVRVMLVPSWLLPMIGQTKASAKSSLLFEVL